MILKCSIRTSFFFDLRPFLCSFSFINLDVISPRENHGSLGTDETTFEVTGQQVLVASAMIDSNVENALVVLSLSTGVQSVHCKNFLRYSRERES
jgi:hypothetical protein